MRKNNKGYSLVELIVVIAIMALLVGTAFLSISIIFGASAKTCSNDIKEALAECKVTAMGKSEAKVEIYKDAADNSIYVIQWIKQGDDWVAKRTDDAGNALPEEVGNSRVYVAYKYKPKDSSVFIEAELVAYTRPAYITGPDSRSLQICYDRGNGAFSDKSEDCVICEEIYVRGGSRSYVLTLTELTGKVALELQ